ncbi:hypothetical protein CLOSTMETH_01954 [[Clostridium] methylpentosum DSM 5476]|uniref:Uncharacterized protein n=1 Tax=[Clostridium] methylpentosum DSM 5476 TaxID=537013 RepID=C0EDM6_9FIRM|nr:hypothetical protein CLOSTMETH_01954 [[Clostridium] methylpentosum DSM 5476]
MAAAPKDVGLVCRTSTSRSLFKDTVCAVGIGCLVFSEQGL